MYQILVNFIQQIGFQLGRIVSGSKTTQLVLFRQKNQLILTPTLMDKGWFSLFLSQVVQFFSIFWKNATPLVLFSTLITCFLYSTKFGMDNWMVILCLTAVSAITTTTLYVRKAPNFSFAVLYKPLSFFNMTQRYAFYWNIISLHMAMTGMLLRFMEASVVFEFLKAYYIAYVFVTAGLILRVIIVTLVFGLRAASMDWFFIMAYFYILRFLLLGIEFLFGVTFVRHGIDLSQITDYSTWGAWISRQETLAADNFTKAMGAAGATIVLGTIYTELPDSAKEAVESRVQPLLKKMEANAYEPGYQKGFFEGKQLVKFGLEQFTMFSNIFIFYISWQGSRKNYSRFSQGNCFKC